jgi:hypothetical protein
LTLSTEALEATRFPEQIMRGLLMAFLSLDSARHMGGGGRARAFASTKKTPAKTTAKTV